MKTVENRIPNTYSRAVKYVLYGLLVFTPMARGSIFLWHHYVIEIAALVIIGFFLLERGLSGGSTLNRTPLDSPIICLLVVVLLSGIFSRSKPDSVEGVALFLSYIVIFYAAIYAIRTRFEQRELVYLVCIMAGLLSVIALLKAKGVAMSIWLYPELPYPQSFLSGVFGNHNHLAGYLEMVIPVSLSLLLTRTRRGLLKVCLLGFSFLLIGTHLGTMSRGGWVALVMALIFMTTVLLFHNSFKRKRSVIIAFFSFVVLILFILSSTNIFERALTLTDNATVMGMGGRGLIWEGTKNMILDNLLLGAGPAAFATVFPQYQLPGAIYKFNHAHNDYLQYISELGVVLVPIYCWLFYCFFKSAFKKYKSSSRQIFGFTLGATAGIVSILVHSFVDFNLHIPANTILSIMLVALVISSPEKGGNRNVL